MDTIDRVALFLVFILFAVMAGLLLNRAEVLEKKVDNLHHLVLQVLVEQVKER